MKKAYNAPKVEKLDFAETSSVTETILSSTGEITTIPTPPEEDNGDVGRGRGRGGGCDGFLTIAMLELSAAAETAAANESHTEAEHESM